MCDIISDTISTDRPLMMCYPIPFNLRQGDAEAAQRKDMEEPDSTIS